MTGGDTWVRVDAKASQYTPGHTARESAPEVPKDIREPPGAVARRLEEPVIGTVSRELPQV